MSLDQVRPALRGRVLVLTGSGISAESGIPTFRGAGGYWRKHHAEQLATQAGFDADPALVWQWYRERRALIAQCEPNAAHRALVALAMRSREFLLVTQNVDDLHERATYEGRRLAPGQLVHLHGEIFVTRCSRCHYETREHDSVEDAAVPPCPRCGSRLRPGVVWFGEELPEKALRQVQSFLATGDCDAVLVIGTTAAFHYIRDWARRGRGRAGLLIEVNPEATELTPLVDLHLASPAAEALPTLIA